MPVLFEGEFRLVLTSEILPKVGLLNCQCITTPRISDSLCLIRLMNAFHLLTFGPSTGTLSEVALHQLVIALGQDGLMKAACRKSFAC